MTARRYSPPERLDARHQLHGFSCGVPAVDAWLTTKAHRNAASGASRTFVTCLAATDQVVGFYSLSASSVTHVGAPGAIRRNMPDPIPVVLLGRLGIDLHHQGAGLGTGLLRDAIIRTAHASATIGVRAILVHAIDDAAARFYGANGFVHGMDDPYTLYLSLAAVRATLSEPPSLR